jgi:mRNA interferase RelE/StbE
VTRPEPIYKVIVAKRAVKVLAKIQGHDRARIRAAIELLSSDPRPKTSKALGGPPGGRLRVRVGDYRIIYTIEDDVLRVLVLAVGHRREIYDR